MDVRIKKNIMRRGWSILTSTKKLAVRIITRPIINDLDAAAPTKPSTISNEDNGAASISYMVFVNLGK